MIEYFRNNWPSIIGIVLILMATGILARLVNQFFKRLILKSAVERGHDPTNYKFLRHFTLAVVYTLGLSIAIYQIPTLSKLANTLLASAGLLTVVVGFAAQSALSNLVSGFFIILFKPFRINDRVTINSISGVVEDISLRHTVIRDFENRRVIIPNSKVSDDVIINADFMEERICRFIEISISYDSDIDLARHIMQDEVQNHPLNLDARTPEQIEQGLPRVTVRVISLGDSSVNLRAWAWAKDQADAFAMGCDVVESIKKRFDREGVEIPFPHRTLVQKQAST
ncbi:MAG: mechanosensitive ion channel family protein [Bacteroidota bacterium]